VARLLLALAPLLPKIMHAQSAYDRHVFFDHSLTPTRYFYSSAQALVHVTHGPVELTARLPAPVPQAGETFRLRVPPAKIHLFDATTTARLAL
jgi:hypothetical protein